MILNKRLLVLSLILCILFGISFVAASDANDDIISAENSDSIAVDDENLVVKEEETVGSFSDLDQDINSNPTSTEVYLNSSYVFDENTDMGYVNQGGVIIDREVTIYGQGHTIDATKNCSIFLVSASNVKVVFKDLTFVNADCTAINKPGGAIFVGSTYTDCYAENCTFINNSGMRGGALYQAYAINSTFINNFGGNPDTYNGGGGAIYYSSLNNGHSVINCTFINNTARTGGALYHCNAINCTFENNSAKDSTLAWGTGGAIFEGDATNCTFIGNCAGNNGGAMISGNAVNCTFKNNYVISNNTYNEGGAIQSPISALNCTFIGNHAYKGGAVQGGEVKDSVFIGNTAYEGGALYFSYADNCTFMDNYAFIGGAISGFSYGSGCDEKNCRFINNSAVHGGAIFDAIAINCQFINNNARAGGAMNRGSATGCIFLDNTAVDAGNDVFNVTDVLFSLTNSPSEGSVAVKIYDAEGVPSIYYILGNANIGGITIGNGTYNAVIAVNEPYIVTIITASAVTTVYNGNKYLVITLKDELGNPMSGVNVTVDLNGIKEMATDANGQIMLSTNNLVPKVYTAKIAFAGDDKFIKSSLNVKVTVKKATVKLTAKRKTFKAKVKTKKYAVTLRDNNNKVMKKVRLYLKIKGKTYKATTNAKGKATFKITKFTKKGRFTSKITFKGNKYYNKLTKKVKIRIK